MLDRTGYLKQFTEVKNEENQARLENISELQGAVTEYERQNPQGGVTDFLENVALVTDLDNMNETGGAITLMTLHSAKGLEFDCVFLAGMEETIFPISRAMFDDNQMEEERRLCLRGHYPGQEKAVHDPRPHPHALQQPSGQPDFPLRFGNSHPADSGRAGRRGHAHSAGGPRAEGSPELRPQTRRQRRFPGHSRGAEGLRRGKRPGPPTQNLFSVGDRVMHRMFGPGTVMELAGTGNAQRARIKFDSGTERIFAVNAAPILKMRK